MNDLTASLTEYVNKQTVVSALSYKAIAENNDCSVDQVRRRVGDVIKAKKELLQPKPKSKSNTESESQNEVLKMILSKLSDIDKKVIGLEKKINRFNSEKWSESLGEKTFRSVGHDTMVKVKLYDGTVTTGYAESFSWDFDSLYRGNFVTEYQVIADVNIKKQLNEIKDELKHLS